MRTIFYGLLLGGSFVAGTAQAGDAATWVRVDATAARVQQVLGRAATSAVGDYGTFQWLRVDAATLARLRGARLGVTVVESPFELVLGGLRFDPLAAPPALPAGWEGSDNARGDEADLRLVQFGGPARQDALDALRAAGVEPLQYVHPFTYVVWGSRAALARAAQRSAVRWSGDFAPAYRVQPQWRALSAGRIEARASVYRGAAGVEDALRAAGAILGEVRELDRHFASIRFSAPGDRFAQLAAIAGVYSLRPVPTDGGLRGEMSAQVNAGNVDAGNLAFPGYLGYLSGIGLDGTGVVVADVDGGIYDTHPDLVNRMLPCSGSSCGGTATDSHGTHTAGIIAADGSSGVTTANGFLRGLGVAPGANLVEQLYDPTFTQAGGMFELMTQSVRNHAVISGNSWGPAGSPQGYDDDTRQVDVGVRDADPVARGDQPLHYVLSIMNGYGGTSSQGSPDEAKNVFTIGSTKMQSSATVQYAAIDDLSANSAHGPARDGRSIPAMVAPGCDVDSTISASGYGLECGTSMASPQVSGASALFFEYYRDRFGHDPSPAMVKAAFTAVAKNLTGRRDADNQVMTHLFDNRQGWGRMQIDPVLAPRQAVQYVDQSTIFDATGEQWTHTYEADDPDQPMRIMLAWTDAPGHGLGGTTPAWNNDLDLRVVAGGETFLGNALGNDGWSVAGGSADGRNNTEAVFLQPAQHGGSVTIEVLAADINSDALPNAGDDTDQDFALVCYNCKDSAAPAAVDLGVSASTAAQAEPGRALAYAVSVANAGPGAADGVTLTATFPASVSPGVQAPSDWTCTSSAAVLRCEHAAPFAAGTSAAFAFSVDVAADAVGSIDATFQAGTTSNDSDPANDAVALSTPVIDRLFADGFEAVTAP